VPKLAENTITILQLEHKFKEPEVPAAESAAGISKLLSKELVDAQRIVIEEASRRFRWRRTAKKTLSVLLKEDLVEPKMEKKTTREARLGL